MTRYRPHPSVSSRRLEDDQILVHMDTGFCFALEGVGVRIWEMLADGATAESVVEGLLAEYEVDRERVVRDVDALLEELIQHDLVVREG